MLVMVSRLGIYLNDHLAASTGALELVKRVIASNRGTAYAEPLAALGAEIEADRRALLAIMGRLGVGQDQVKRAAAWSAEKLGRLKLNGQLTGYSPLSRLEELEILELGVTGKLQLWQALLEIRPDGVSKTELEELSERARSQRERLERLRQDAATEALGAPETST
jgi:hypothetical protein